jgi:hypothetical protein
VPPGLTHYNFQVWREQIRRDEGRVIDRRVADPQAQAIVVLHRKHIRPQFVDLDVTLDKGADEIIITICQNSACADGVVQHRERATGDFLHPAAGIDHFINVIELADHVLDAEPGFIAPAPGCGLAAMMALAA